MDINSAFAENFLEKGGIDNKAVGKRTLGSLFRCRCSGGFSWEAAVKRGDVGRRWAGAGGGGSGFFLKR